VGRGWTRWAARTKLATVANRPHPGDDDDDDDDDDNYGHVLEDAVLRWTVKLNILNNHFRPT